MSGVSTMLRHRLRQGSAAEALQKKHRVRRRMFRLCSRSSAYKRLFASPIFLQRCCRSLFVNCGPCPVLSGNLGSGRVLRPSTGSMESKVETLARALSHPRGGLASGLRIAAMIAAQLQALSTDILQGSTGAPALWQQGGRCLRPDKVSNCAAAGVEAATLHKLLAALQEFVLRRAYASLYWLRPVCRNVLVLLALSQAGQLCHRRVEKQEAGAPAAFQAALDAAESLCKRLTASGSGKLMVSTFWESIAAPLLQPGPADLSYLAWLDRLVSSGLLRPLLAALTSAGKASKLQYLSHADADAAVSLLLSLSVATAEPLGMQLLDSAGALLVAMFLFVYADTAASPTAGDSLAAAQLLRKRLTASHVNEAMRRGMLSTLFTTFAAFLQVVRHGLLHVPRGVFEPAHRMSLTQCRCFQDACTQRRMSDEASSSAPQAEDDLPRRAFLVCAPLPLQTVISYSTSAAAINLLALLTAAALPQHAVPRKLAALPCARQHVRLLLHCKPACCCVPGQKQGRCGPAGAPRAGADERRGSA